MDVKEVFISSLGSGSGGNAFIIEYGAEALIVDQGFSRKELLNRMEAIGFDPARLCGALLTHEHTDHSKGSRVFCDALGVTLYTTSGTALYLRNKNQLPRQVRAFEPGASFEIGSFTVQSFALPHDAVDPVGFTLHCGECKIGIATDLGRTDANILKQLTGCDALIIESNYDKTMLMNSDRRLELKRRICGVRGHLGNTDTCDLLPKVLCERCKVLFLAHISSECNRSDIVEECCMESLRQIPCSSKLYVEILSQHAPSRRVSLNPPVITEAVQEELF